MSNTRPVPNLTAPFGEVKNENGKVIGKVWLISPWMQFFQQFVQRAPTVEDVTSGGSPYQANQNGTVIVTGAATVSLIRGQVTINLTGERIIPISIGDSIAWTGGATVQFLGA